MLAVPLLAAALGVVLLRFGWGRTGGVAVGGGWALIFAGLGMLVWGDGAWGLALGTSAAILAALGLLGQAALTTPAGRQAPVREPAPSLPLRGDGLRGIGRRVAVFLCVVPAAAATSVLIALAGQALARAAGWHPADSGVAGLVLFPVAWTILATMLLLKDGPLRMALILGLAGLPAFILYWGFA